MTLGSQHAAYTKVCCRAGPIAIVEGRHPVIEALSETPFQPNDPFMADTSSFHIIGGPNMAGKSTYLRQARTWHATIRQFLSCGAHCRC